MGQREVCEGKGAASWSGWRGISSLLQEEIAADPDSDEIHLLVRPVLMGGILEPAPGTDFRARRFNVQRDRLPARVNDQSLREKARNHLITLSDLAKELSVDGPMVWPLIARQAGCAQVVLSIWDAAGLRPLDYIVVSVPVGEVGQSRVRGRRPPRSFPHLQQLLHSGHQFTASETDVTGLRASAFSVDTDFGTRLSVSFVAVAQQLRASDTSARVIDIFNQALQKTIDTYGPGSGYADMALEFQIIGDPELHMCSAPTASNQKARGVQ